MTNPDRGSRRRSGGFLCRGPVAAALGVAFSLALLQSLGAQVWDEPMAGAQAPGAAVTGARAADATLTGAQMSDAGAIGSDTGSRELSLAAALSLAERQADALKLERSSLTRASLAVREARARLGPELTFSATGAYLSNPPGITVEAGALGSFDFQTAPPPALPVTILVPGEDVEFREIAGNTWFELDLELKQPLFTWLKLRNAVKLAELAVDVSAAELEEARRRIRRETAESYYLAVLARESVAGLERIGALFAEIEADRRSAYELGLVNLEDLLGIQAQVAEAAQRLLDARENQATALAALGFYTGVSTSELALSTTFPAEETHFDEELLRRRSAESSPTVRKLRVQIEQARRNAARLRGGGAFRPDVALSVALEITGQQPPWSGGGWQDSWNANLTVGLGAEGALFDSGRSRWQVKAAEETVRSAEEALALGTRQLELAVRKAVHEARVAWGMIQAGRAAVRAKTEAERNAREAFAQELLTREQLGFARLDRLRTELALLRAGHDFAVALVRLEYLAGASP
jgi:outer membrane protein